VPSGSGGGTAAITCRPDGTVPAVIADDVSPSPETLAGS